MKDQLLNVIYRRGENGQLHVFIYRGQLHIGTIEVNALNSLKVFRGIENGSPVLVQYLPKEAA